MPVACSRRKKKPGKLQTTVHEQEEYIKDQLSDSQREIPFGSPGHVPLPPEPSSQFDNTPPKWSGVKQVVEQVRAASAPGPNSVSYKVYKHCPMTLWKLMNITQRKQSISPAWSRAVTNFIPKEKDSHNISQLRGIALLNVERKISFSVMAKWITSYLLTNNYIAIVNYDLGTDPDSEVEQIRAACHLAGPCKCLWVRSPPTHTLQQYFNNFHVYYTTQEILLVPAGERDSNGLLHFPHRLLSRWCEE